MSVTFQIGDSEIERLKKITGRHDADAAIRAVWKAGHEAFAARLGLERRVRAAERRLRAGRRMEVASGAQLLRDIESLRHK